MFQFLSLMILQQLFFFCKNCFAKQSKHFSISKSKNIHSTLLQYIHTPLRDYSFIFSFIFPNKSLLLRMYQPPQVSITMHPFSEEEQCLLLTFDQELKKTIDTLNIEKQKSNLFRNQKLLLEQEVHSKNSQLAEMTLIHERQKEKLKHELEEKIKHLQQINKISPNKITSIKPSPKKQVIKKHTASESQAKEQKPDRQQKSLTKGFKLMLLQEFVQFFAALILTRIKFPRKFKSIKRILPMTFILLRLGVFILATQFKKVCSYIRSVTTGEEQTGILIKKIGILLPFFGFASNQAHKEVHRRNDSGVKSLITKIFPLF